jgi:hypothetical protein
MHISPGAYLPRAYAPGCRNWQAFVNHPQANTRPSAHGIGPLSVPRRCPKRIKENAMEARPMLDLTYETPKPKIMSGAKQDWELVIGMEVHAQVSSKAKLFSGASTAFGAEPNSNVAFVDAGMPGMLPVINEFCVAQAVRTGLGPEGRDQPALRLRPQELLLPRPAAGLPDQPALPPHRGRGRSAGRDGRRHVARGADRAHPPGTGRRQVDPRHGPAMSFVDLNRTGVALMEIVSRPDIRGPEEAAPMSPSCARSCAISAPATATCRTATCAPT